MKNLVTVLLIALSFASFGQVNFVDVGVEGGFSLASVRGNEIIDKYQNPRIGFASGLFVQYNFKKIISIRTGGYYERKGSSLEFQATDELGNPIGEIHGKENFDYITVPLLLRATIGQKLNYFVNVGPYMGFLIKQTEYIEAFKDFPETTSDRTEYFKKTETGLSFGLGLAYILKEKFAFSFEARNNLGLTNTSELVVYNNGEIMTNALNFLFGFSYKLGDRKSNTK